MSRRRDRLASVLRIRKVQQDLAAAERGRADQVVADEEARFAARQADVVNPWTERGLVELAFAAADRAAGSLAAADAAAEERRAAHLDAVRAARAIERLVERRRAEANREELRELGLELDDLAGIAHTRGRRR